MRPFLVRLGEPPGCGGVAPACAAVGSPMTQHEMGKVDVPLVRRRVRAHGHEAHVAERAGVHDRLEARGVDRIQLARFGFVNQVEQARKGVAEAEAAPAAVADVEDAARFPLQRLAVVEIGVFASLWDGGRARPRRPSRRLCYRHEPQSRLPGPALSNERPQRRQRRWLSCASRRSSSASSSESEIIPGPRSTFLAASRRASHLVRR